MYINHVLKFIKHIKFQQNVEKVYGIQGKVHLLNVCSVCLIMYQYG
jgi:hypothetical protein